MNTPIVQAKNLSKKYGHTTAVKDLTFAIRRGEIFGFLGPNGAGKTTTISMLACLQEPSRGTATIDGYDVVKQARQAKWRIGLVPQELALYPTLSARDNLNYFGSIYGLRGRTLRQRVDNALDMVGLSDRAKQAVKTYSGGMKRRLNIAIGLLHNPEVLFLDEPTVGVDPQSRNAIFEHVERLNQAGMTILYTTHYMEEAQRLCHRVAIIDEGTFVALDTPQKLIADLGGIIHVGIGNGAGNSMARKITTLPHVDAATRLNGKIEVKTRQPRQALLHILDLCNKTDTNITSLEVLESNLETVFLHLTGKHLRD